MELNTRRRRGLTIVILEFEKHLVKTPSRHCIWVKTKLPIAHCPLPIAHCQLAHQFQGHGITPEGLLIPLNINEISVVFGLRGAWLSFEIVTS